MIEKLKRGYLCDHFGCVSARTLYGGTKEIIVLKIKSKIKKLFGSSDEELCFRGYTICWFSYPLGLEPRVFGLTEKKLNLMWNKHLHNNGEEETK